MKRSVVFIAMMILASFLFASVSEVLLINISVASNTPVFKMVGGETQSYGTEAGPTNNPGIITSSKNIHSEGLDIYLKISQGVRTNPPSAGYIVDVSIEATPLSTTVNGDTRESGIPNVASATAGTSTADFTSTKTTLDNEGDGIVGFRVTYVTANPVPSDTVVGTVHYQWVADDTLPSGEYVATITMTYTSGQ